MIDDLDRTADQFEALLNRNQVPVTNGSRLQDALTFPRHVLHVRNGTGNIGTHDDRAQWREMIGIYDLAKRLLVAEQAAPNKFEALKPWLKLFASTRGQLAQTATTAQNDQESDKTFELLVALCLLPVIDQLEPDLGRGDNPDLLFKFGSHTWGIACKRLYSILPFRFQKTVTKAIAQIEASAAERGLVFVNLVNVVGHDRFYPMTEDGCYMGMSHERMMQVLEAEENRISDDIVGVTDGQLANEFRGKKAMPGIVHYIGTTYLTGSPDAPSLNTVQHAFSRGLVNELLHMFQDGLNSTSSAYRDRTYVDSSTTRFL